MRSQRRTGDQELQFVVNVEAAVLEKPDDDGDGDHGEDDKMLFNPLGSYWVLG